MLEDSDPLLIAKTSRVSAERALGILLLTMLFVTLVIHGGH